jgi:hypothetical protein
LQGSDTQRVPHVASPANNFVSASTSHFGRYRTSALPLPGILQLQVTRFLYQAPIRLTI